MSHTQRIRCMPFGGVGEFGKNMMVYALGNDAVIVDCGMGFPAPGQHGVDLVIPDISALKGMGLKLHALLLTHGHEDHIGAVPFLLPQFGKIPVYGTPVTLAMVQAKLTEHHLKADLRPLSLEDEIPVGPFTVEAIPVTHSIMDAASIVVHTPLGAIVHTGDFRFDPSPVDGKATPIHRFSRVGDRGVLLLASDSTNATRSGSCASERSVAPALRQAIAGCKGKVVVTTFASNMFRIQQIIDAAVANGRSVALAGRSLDKNVGITRDLGRLNIPGGSLIDIKQIDNLPDRELLIIATGSQGEWRAALARIAQNKFTGLRLGEGDLVIFSSSAIPGNERVIAGLFNHIYRRGARILHSGQAHLHVSGHAQAHELKMMMQLTRPRYFYPVHGEYRNLVEHQSLATAAGIPFERTVMAENGQMVVVDSKKIRRGDTFHAGAVFVDSTSRDELDDLVLRDRRALADDGIISITVVLNRNEGTLLMPPEMLARGVLHEDISDDILDKATDELANYLKQQSQESLADLDQTTEDVRVWMRRWCKRHIKRRPMVLPVVVEV